MDQYINGRRVKGRGKPFEVINPATDEVIASVNAADEVQTIEALEAAQAAFKAWSQNTVSERLAWIAKFRDAILAERDTLTDLVAREVGKSYPEADAECSGIANLLNFYSEEVKRVYGTTLVDYGSKPGEMLHFVRGYPVGVTVGLIAWNWPLNEAGRKIAPALAAGCTCVIKPASYTPLATLHLGVIAQKIDLPKGVLNIVAGPSSVVGKTLNESKIPALIGLIGSSDTGRQVLSQGSTSVKRFSLELGGNAPAVVMPDADLESTAAFLIQRKTVNACAGQGCAQPNRLYVHASVHDTFVDLLLQNIRRVKIGWGREVGDAMGSLISKAERDRVLGLIRDATEKGAKLLYGGKIPENQTVGAFIMPTLLDNAQDNMRVCHEEIFGPVFPVFTFSDLNEVIARANDTDAGLTSYLFSHDTRVISKVCEEFAFGEVLVNNPTHGAVFLPHVGIKQSGVGCDYSKWSLEEYFWKRLISIRS